MEKDYMFMIGILCIFFLVFFSLLVGIAKIERIPATQHTVIKGENHD